MTDKRQCTLCLQVKPLDGFSGPATRCKPCRAEMRRRSRAGLPPLPAPQRSLVLVMPTRPAPPEDPPAADAETREPATPARPRGHYGTAVEAFLTALDPPLTPADGILAHGLRHLGELADLLVDTDDIQRALLSMTRLQRELLGTRAARARVPQAKEPGQTAKPKGKLTTFRDAL